MADQAIPGPPVADHGKPSRWVARATFQRQGYHIARDGERGNARLRSAGDVARESDGG
jgi:hypothetical protein